MTSTLAGPFTYLGGAYPGASATCSSTLMAGASCALNIAFTPSATGTAMATLSVTYFDGAQTIAATRDLSGKGTSHAFLSVTDFPLQYYEQYALQADASTFAFGPHGVGSTTTHAFSFTNMGAVPATGLSGGTLPAPFSYAGGTFPGAGGNCSTTLATGDQCSVVVAFTPARIVLQHRDAVARVRRRQRTRDRIAPAVRERHQRTADGRPGFRRHQPDTVGLGLRHPRDQPSRRRTSSTS